MKRIIKYLLILVLFIPFIVMADGAAPQFAPYDAYVSDKDGASLYTLDDQGENLTQTTHFLEYNHNIKIINEEEISDNMYFGIIEYNGEEYYINLSKISLLKDEYTLEDLKKELGDRYEDADSYGKDDSFITIDNTTDIYYGPSVKYKVKKENIDKETILYPMAEIQGWVYVKNDSYSGWINEDAAVGRSLNKTIWFLEDTQLYDGTIKEGKIVEDKTITKDEKFIDVYRYDYFSEQNEYISMFRLEYENNVYYVDEEKAKYAISSEDKVMSVKELKIYDVIKGEEIGSLPINTKIETQYYSDGYEYIKYNEIEGWIEDKYLANYSDDSMIMPKNVVGYTSLDRKATKTIPANTEIKDHYSYYVDDDNEMHYISYNNKNYWVYDKDICLNLEDELGETEIVNDLEVYVRPSGDKTGKTIPKGTKVNVKYYYYESTSEEDEEEIVKYWYYVSDKNYKGWILDEEEDLEELKTAVIESQQDPEEVISSKNTESKTIMVKNKISTKEYIIIGALSAVILALVIYVVILLVNKKKQENIETIQIEQPIEENKDA